ncbi:hypothetical protein JW824_08065 [bacterium]|nr:hypothetical protein [bacterium]
MKEKDKYKDKKLVDSACDNILQVIKPGDVVNQVGDFKWYEFWLSMGSKSIQSHQKDLFGKNSNWKDDHTMMFFDKDNTLSVELPIATVKPLEKYCLSNLSIYRLRLIELKADHITTMRKSANDMLGTDYDIGQLLDIAINQILGYEHQRRLSIFDFGRKKKVCSVGVRVVFEHLYQQRIRTSDSDSGKWLFDKLNADKWPEKKVEQFNGTDVEATSPAHFANSDYFCNEFELIARFNNGTQYKG